MTDEEKLKLLEENFLLRQQVEDLRAKVKKAEEIKAKWRGVAQRRKRERDQMALKKKTPTAAEMQAEMQEMEADLRQARKDARRFREQANSLHQEHVDLMKFIKEARPDLFGKVM